MKLITVITLSPFVTGFAAAYLLDDHENVYGRRSVHVLSARDADLLEDMGYSEAMNHLARRGVTSSRPKALSQAGGARSSFNSQAAPKAPHGPTKDNTKMPQHNVYGHEVPKSPWPDVASKQTHSSSNMPKRKLEKASPRMNFGSDTSSPPKPQHNMYGHEVPQSPWSDVAPQQSHRSSSMPQRKLGKAGPRMNFGPDTSSPPMPQSPFAQAAQQPFQKR